MTITYRQQISYCGKARCQRCLDGQGHGPYWYAYEIVNGQTKRSYVGKELPPDIEAQYVKQATPVARSVSVEVEQVALRLYTLGQFRVERRRAAEQWETVTEAGWQQQGVRSIIACLLTHGRKLHREQLIEALWPEAEVSQTSRLDRLLYTARQLFEPERSRFTASQILASEGDIVVLSPKHVWSDIDTFEQLVRNIPGKSDPGEQERLLDEALLLYQGPFLPHEHGHPSIALRREYVQRSLVGLLLRQADLRSAREDLVGALEPIERVLALDPMNEAGVQRHMLLFAQMGRRSEAIRAYKRLVSLLHQHEHIIPLPPTRQLYEGIRQGRSQLSLRLQQQRTSSQTSPASALPLQEHVPTFSGRHHATALVGRDQERTRVREVLAELQRRLLLKLPGQPRSVLEHQPGPLQCALILGEVGIGKTRLAEELAHDAYREGWVVAWSRVYEQERSIPYRAWTALLRQAMRLCRWDWNELTKKPLLYYPLCTLLPELYDRLPEVALPIRTPEQEEVFLWEAVQALLNVLSLNTPLLLVIDDMHWSDERSMQLWTYLVRRMQGYPLMLIGTMREHEQPTLQRACIELARDRRGVILRLHPLAHDHIAQLLPESLPAQTSSQIIARAAGNPLFAEELARQACHQQEEEVLDPARRAKDITGRRPIHNILLPDTIDAALEIRLRQLSPACHRLLTKAAVLGQSFELDVLVAMESQASGLSEEQVLNTLEEATRAGILTEIEQNELAAVQYQFWHPLLITHLYEHLSVARRVHAHRQAALVLKRQAQEQRPNIRMNLAAAIVHHLQGGGGEPAELAFYAEQAAVRAYDIMACHDAEHYFQLALQAHAQMATKGEQVQLLWEQLADVYRIVCKSAESRDAYAQALSMHLATPDPSPMHAQIHTLYLVEIAHTHYNSASLVQAEETLQQATTCLLTARIVDGTAWGELRYIQAYLLWKKGEYESALAAAQEALSHFHAALASKDAPTHPLPRSHLRRTLQGDPADIGRVHRFLGALLSSYSPSSTIQEALAHQFEAKAIFEKQGCIREAGSILCDIGNVYLQLADHSCADQYFEQCLQAVERIGDSGIQCVAQCNRGIVAHRRGQREDAHRFYTIALRLAREAHDPVYELFVHALHAALFLEDGQEEAAKAPITAACVLARTMDNEPCTAIVLIALAQFRLQQATILEREPQQSGTAHRLLLRAKFLLRRALLLRMDIDARLEALFLYAQVYWQLGEDETLDLARQALQEAEQVGAFWMRARAQRLLASILGQQGQLEEARHLFEAAIATFRHDENCQEYILACEQRAQYL